MNAREAHTVYGWVDVTVSIGFATTFAFKYFS